MLVRPGPTDALDKYVQLCFRLWSSPWVFLERAAAVYKSEPAPSAASLPALQMEADLRQEERLTSVAVLNRDLLRRRDGGNGPETVLRRQEPLTSKFSVLYNPQWDWSRGVAFALADRNYSRLGDPNASKIFQKPESIQFMVEPAELTMAGRSGGAVFLLAGSFSCWAQVEDQRDGFTTWLAPAAISRRCVM